MENRTQDTYSDETVRILGPSDFGGDQDGLRDGWRFMGWNTMSDGTGTQYEPDSTLYFNQSTTLYAQWWKLRCWVRFDANGGEISGLADRELNWGAEVGVLPVAVFNKEDDFAGNEFLGWFTASGDMVDEHYIVPEQSEIVLYAHWIGVIHYQVVNNYDNNIVEIDANNVATGFKGEASTEKYCAIRAIDKFDFSGNFTIVMKGKAALAASRQDMFAGHN